MIAAPGSDHPAARQEARQTTDGVLPRDVYKRQDKDHVHFLVQSTPNYSPAKVITTIKSITAKRIFAECPEVKKQLWGGSFWREGYYVSSVGKHTSEKAVQRYVQNQGKQDEYKQLYLHV